MIVKSIVCMIGLAKIFLYKLFHWNRIVVGMKTIAFPSVRIEMGEKSKIKIGKGVSIRRNCEINARDNSEIIIGDNVFFNTGCILTSHKRIAIGKNVEFGPYVMVFDHDHKYKEGYMARDFDSDEIVIGDNTWIGANTIILRGTEIGENCVIAAGSVIKGRIPSNSITVQKRTTTFV